MHPLTIALLLASPAAPLAPAPAPPPPPGTKVIELPAGAPRVDMDYLAAERGADRIWAPAGNTGRVDVVDVATGSIKSVEGFPTAQRKERTVGPSSATVGEGFVFVGNRGDSSVCAIDAKTLTKGGCVTLDSSPDGICWVSSTHEVWVTTPRSKGMAILDASHAPSLKKVADFTLEGEPEGYAVDPGHGVFFTNLEDADKTLAIDIKTHKVLSTWSPGCGEGGPKGLAVDVADQVLMVACPDHIVALDLKANGKIISQVPTGAGVDNIDYLEPQHRLFVTAGKDAKFTVVKNTRGVLSVERSQESAKGGRVVVVDGQGNAFVADSANGRLLEFPASK